MINNEINNAIEKAVKPKSILSNKPTALMKKSIHKTVNITLMKK